MKKSPHSIASGKFRQEQGYVLMGVLFLLTLSLVVASGMLSSARVNSKTRAVVNKQADYYYEAETVLNKVVAWMQENSKSLVTPFLAADFATNFDLGTPSFGDNEGSQFSTSTMMKMAGTNNSVMLSNETFFGTSEFPAATHIDTGVPFDAITEFNSADFGGSANARIVGIWARETDSNYEPVFRVDVITGNNPDRGVHSFSYIYSTLVVETPFFPGFYGEDSLSTNSANNSCSSYEYTWNAGTSTWTRGAPRSNCPVASQGPISLKAQVNGDVKTNTDDGITYNPPSGSATGDTCDGPGCYTYSMPSLSTVFTDYCPASQGDVTVSSSVSWGSDATNPNNCWEDVTIDNNKTLTLTDTTNPYYFNSISMSGNGKIAFPTVASGNTIKIYVGKWNSNDRLNGNNVVNTNNAPATLEIYYWGTTDFLFNGTADMNAVFYAPNANVDMNGNFSFYGGMHAKTLDVLGQTRLNFDESLLPGAPVVKDINFAIHKASQRYR